MPASAFYFDVSGQAVSKWERALGLPDIELLSALAKIFNIPLERLLDENHSPAEVKPHSPEVAVYDIGVWELNRQMKSDQMILIYMGVELCKRLFPPKSADPPENTFHDADNNAFIRGAWEQRIDTLTRWGVLLPAIRIRDDAKLKECECAIWIYGKKVWEKDFDGAEASGEEINAEILSAAGEAIDANLSAFINQHMVKLLVESAKAAMPFIFEEIIPGRVSLTALRDVLREVVRRGHTIRNFVQIVEAVDAGRQYNAESGEGVYDIPRMVSDMENNILNP
jgi:transcriptional regulator with XRE-family HTH domain